MSLTELRSGNLQKELVLILVAVGLSGILKAKHKLFVTFNFDKQDVIYFKKFSKSKFIKVVVDPLFFWAKKL